MSHDFLFVLWAGGGNVPPQLTLARRLVTRGHRVRMLAPAVLATRSRRPGSRSSRTARSLEHDESVPERSLVRDFEARSKAAALAAARDNLLAAMAGPVAADVLSTLERRPADVVAFDYVLFGSLFAAEKAGIPAAMLIHTVYPFPAPGLPPYGMGWDADGRPAWKAARGCRAADLRQVSTTALPASTRFVRRSVSNPCARSTSSSSESTVPSCSPRRHSTSLRACPRTSPYVGPQLDPVAADPCLGLTVAARG